MPSVSTTEPHQLVPLCVDLDGTLIYTDLLWESLVQLLKHKPLSFLLVPFWWARGRAYLKAQLAARVSLEPASLPYNEPLLRFLREEQRRGRPIYLVTASDSLLARPVADHLRLFNEVLASDGVTNLRGKNKGARLSQRFGGRGFDYAGNSTVDLPVWEQSRQAIVVNGSRSLAARAAQLAPVNRVFESQTSIVWSLVRALRPHQ